MADLETRALESFLDAPSVWYRYVNDVLSIVKKRLVEDLLDHLSIQQENISFTVEVEHDGKLPFMDVLLQRRKDGTINTRVY